jgi:hypothetical protein
VLVRRIVSVMLALAAMLVSGASSASAGPVGGNSGANQGAGYSVTAVSFSGDAAPGGGGTISVGVPATCWWEPAQLSLADGSYIDPTNPDELEAWYMYAMPAMNGTFAIGRVTYGDFAIWKPALEKMRAGAKVTAYSPTCRLDASDCALIGFSGVAMEPNRLTGECGISVGIGFFTSGDPPAPQVAPADLAKVASDHMDIPDPLVDRNPKVTALAGATLVGLPTWFWVTDPASIGGAAGTRTIRAEVHGVWAEVVAKTEGLHLTSPAGGTSCGPDTALTQYARGVDEGTACTLSFSRASVGYPAGYPVDASTVWTAAWTGSGNTGGNLASLLRGRLVDVPVAESQTVVTGAR